MSETAVTADGNVRKSLRDVWFFLALTFAISWGIDAAYLLFPGTTVRFGPMTLTSAGFYIASYAPTISAIVLSLVFGGDLKTLFAGLIRPFKPVWLLVAVLTFPLIALLLATAMSLTGRHWPVQAHTILVALPLLLFTTGQIFANPGPLGEELGWRGYMLPRLLERWNVWVCGLIVGFFWMIWHIPTALALGQHISFLPFSHWVLNIFALSLFMAWLFVRAGGNVVVAGMIPHFVVNGMGRLGAWTSRSSEIALLALLVLVYLAAIERKKQKG